MLISRVPFPPFVVDHDIVRDRFGGHVCEVDPHGIVYTDEKRAHLTQLVCDALNRDADGRDMERGAVVAWLREYAAPSPSDADNLGAWAPGAATVGRLADAIERGEHRREEKR